MRIVKKRTLLILALLLLHCMPKTNMTALISMMDGQEKYFANSVVPDFAKQEKISIKIEHYNIDSAAEFIDKTADAGIIKVPFGKSRALVESKKILPLESFLTPKQITEYEDVYLLTTLAQSDGKHYYVPRKFETRIMVYRKSRVADAIALWRNKKNLISEELKLYNGYGLPSNYILEDDPNEWDYYDIFVVGWIWAHTMYNGTTAPKIAHRGKAYSGTSQRVIDRVFQCNGDSADVVSLSGEPVADAFHWEALYASAGVYNSRMWSEKWSGSGVWRGFKSNDVFLSFMTQLDCFFIHGTGQDGLDGFLENPKDMGVAVMPKGCSVELGENGIPLRQGSRAITTGGWWWGIPSSTKNPQISYKLVQHITNLDNQIQGCSRFGMIPVRKDVLSDMNMLFGGDWISEIYSVSFRQLMLNEFTTLPAHPKFSEISMVYLDAWFDIVVDKNWAENGKLPDFNYINTLLKKKYATAVAKL